MSRIHNEMQLSYHGDLFLSAPQRGKNLKSPTRPFLAPEYSGLIGKCCNQTVNVTRHGKSKPVATVVNLFRILDKHLELVGALRDLRI